MKRTEGQFFRMLIGSQNSGELHRTIPVGFAIQPQGRSYFVVRPWALPRICYYLVPHSRKSQCTRYTLFGKRVEKDTGVLHFQNPIGHGEYSSGLSGYIAVDLRFPMGRFYLDLHGKPDPDRVPIVIASASPAQEDPSPTSELTSRVVLFQPKNQKVSHA